MVPSFPVPEARGSDGGAAARAKGAASARTAAKPRASWVRCPYCHDELGSLGGRVACAECGARYHRSCRKELGSCATCGAHAMLEPAKPRWGPRALRPPAGSRLRVERRGASTLYRWALGRREDLGLALLVSLLTFFLAPLVFLLLWSQGRGEKRLVLGPRWLEAEFTTFWGPRTTRIPRGGVDRVDVARFGAGWCLCIDEGTQRHVVAVGGALRPALSGAELAWLAERIRDWSEGASD
ncbi:MAG: hypothetical protein D6731_10285 [Planctomycetota bacterium]|nr:MAG: hypothetical protein D6731_10285 [Planctomycetota bacterium]